MTPPIVIIDLDARRGTTCHACEAETPVGFGLPVDENGDIVPNEYPGPWAGVPACQSCHDAHAEGGLVALRHRLLALQELRPGP